ncbi:hypothetical protein DYB37_001477 [Aphanomyces astaci]|uniref:Major facilitator superfamily (MFS) profile domain-containing protein n=1 Tax=Aphanomyces astaci TaxID=112090 RepID=A0A3R7BAD7_APHAT|nr:hypothetical protein DYB35_005262 [Aphanomyces astaci]RHZ17298.1 hypothetical protein DYB37_001477 [Aphanomyces astaci]
MPPWIFVLLCAINFVNYFDRGITSGAPAQFQYFIQVSHNTTDPGALLGLLSSSFVTTFAISIPLFGYLAMTTKPFRLISIGLVVWVVAVALSSVSKSANSFELLLLGRFLSGVGEASFQCIAPPFINDHSPSNFQTMWLSVYMISATVGSILGGIAASMLSSSWGWDSVFAMEGLAMVPLLWLCCFGVPDEFNRIRNDNPTESQSLLAIESDSHKSFFGEVWDVCTNAVFAWLSLGVAAMMFSSAGLGIFITLLLLGLGVFSSETDANVTMGFVTAALGAMLLSLAALPDRTWFLVWNGLMGVIAGTISPVVMIAMFHSVHPSQQALAVGLNSLSQHVLGDVPAPIIMGYIKDAWAPHCNSVLVDRVVVLNPECHQDKDGLIQAMMFPLAWMAWAVACFGIALYFARRNMVKAKNALLDSL